MSNEQESNAARSFGFCSLFESEVLVCLMLQTWNHPLASDEEFPSQLLETATEVLKAATEGPPDQVFIANMPAQDMNLIAAVWYAEQGAIEDLDTTNTEEIEQRKKWLDTVRRTLPSCFCSQDDLS